MRQTNLKQQLKATTLIAFIVFSACVFNSCDDTSKKSTEKTDSTTVHITDSTNMHMDSGKMMKDTITNPMPSTKGDQLPPPK